MIFFEIVGIIVSVLIAALIAAYVFEFVSVERKAEEDEPRLGGTD